MLGVYDFCGHYDWTFAWLHRVGGDPLVREYWDSAIHQDSQTHAAALILEKGFDGMAEYWGHTLREEGAAYHTSRAPGVFRIDMHDCPSKGFLIRNGLEQYHDYCDHCMGWIGPLMKRAGFVIDHQHNHCGQCWWELRRASDLTAPSQPGSLAKEQDVRTGPAWAASDAIDTYIRANQPHSTLPGVRPSPGAATACLPCAPELAPSPTRSHVAAAEDGRTPSKTGSQTPPTAL